MHLKPDPDQLLYRVCTLPSISEPLPLAVQQESCDSITNQAERQMDDLSCYATVFYVHAINTWQLTKHQAIDYLQNLFRIHWLMRCIFEISKWRQ